MSREIELQFIDKANFAREMAIGQMTEAVLGKDKGLDPEVVTTSMLPAIFLSLQETNALLRAIYVQGHECDDECPAPDDSGPGPMVFQVGLDGLPEQVAELLEKLVGAEPAEPSEEEQADEPAEASTG